MLPSIKYSDVKLKHFYKMTNKLGGFERCCDGLVLYLWHVQ